MITPPISLTGEWRHLALVSWRVDAALLAPFVPRGTTLDRWEGHPYLSVVGLRFLHLGVGGVPVPLHGDFSQVNLRFYVRREVGGETRRGAVFLRELVALPTLTAAARLTIGEPYETMPVRCRVVFHPGEAREPTVVEYAWGSGKREGLVTLVVEAGSGRPLPAGSREEFIAERCWGYAAQRDGSTAEYRVEHPRWRVWRSENTVVSGDLAAAFDPVFADVMREPPDSAFVAEGSAMTVHPPSTF
ncbi:MAG TPA: DUF2071 domain-containing protein [Gemmatimonadaceae bacterium]|nr:DUF2071 domain-containing protein [Gemmatimonadaceae bacterium]